MNIITLPKANLLIIYSLLCSVFYEKKPANIIGVTGTNGKTTVATLLFKPDAYKKDIKIDFIGKSIPNDFVVGYGLDYDEIGRNLPHIYKLKN